MVAKSAMATGSLAMIGCSLADRQRRGILALRRRHQAPVDLHVVARHPRQREAVLDRRAARLPEAGASSLGNAATAWSTSSTSMPVTPSSITSRTDPRG